MKKYVKPNLMIEPFIITAVANCSISAGSEGVLSSSDAPGIIPAGQTLFASLSCSINANDVSVINYFKGLGLNIFGS